MRQVVGLAFVAESAATNSAGEGEENRVAAPSRHRVRFPIGCDVEDVGPLAVDIPYLPSQAVEPPLRPNLGPHRFTRVDQFVHIAGTVAGSLRAMRTSNDTMAPQVALPMRAIDCTLRTTRPRGRFSCRHSMQPSLFGLPDRFLRPPVYRLRTRNLVARSLVDANLCGHDSHGVMRVPQYIEFIRKGTYRTSVPLTTLNETPALLATDANWGLGQVQAYRLLEKLIPKAKSLGVAAGTLRNCGHVGRLGEYAEFVAQEQMALFAAVNSHGSGRRVAPPGGIEGRISTNPICLSAPTSTDPVVMDFGTSAAAEGKVRAQFQKKQPCPEGWLIDHTGAPTLRPERAVHRTAWEPRAIRRHASLQGIRSRIIARPALRRALRRLVQQSRVSASRCWERGRVRDPGSRALRRNRSLSE